MKNKVGIFIKLIILAVVSCLVFVNVQAVLTDKIAGDYMKLHDVFKEPENSFDAVFLGSSATYAYWNPAVAWNEKGIAVYSMTNASQPVEISHYLIDDIRKKQPDALYIINITRMLEAKEYYNAKIHRFVGTYPFSLNKYKALGYMLDITNVPLMDRVEYYFPILRFHSRWKNLKEFDLTFKAVNYKSANKGKEYLKNSVPQQPVVYNFEDYRKITDTMKNSLDVIMNYCKQEKVKVLFVLMPQALHKENRNGRQNTVAKILQDNGFDVLDLRKKTEEIGIDFSKHYYDKRHTNIHGSLLITDYISDYLIENYGFEDKRGREDYASWDKSCKAYYKYISGYLWDEDYNILKSAVKPTDEQSKS